jgi:hypothetical protein
MDVFHKREWRKSFLRAPAFFFVKHRESGSARADRDGLDGLIAFYLNKKNPRALRLQDLLLLRREKCSKGDSNTHRFPY